MYKIPRAPEKELATLGAVSTVHVGFMNNTDCKFESLLVSERIFEAVQSIFPFSTSPSMEMHVETSDDARQTAWIVEERTCVMHNICLPLDCHSEPHFSPGQGP